jgi:hypothetical protein
MKIKLLSSILIILSFILFGFTKQQGACALLLTNAKTNKSINLCDKNSVQKIEAVLGGAISLDKEIPDANEEPIFTFKYDGVVIDLQDEKIRNITITNKKWRLNTLSVGITLEQMLAKFERVEFNYLGHPRFKLKDSKAIIFTETDEAKKVKAIGVVF